MITERILSNRRSNDPVQDTAIDLYQRAPIMKFLLSQECGFLIFTLSVFWSRQGP
jgi:hypothetical protein